MVCKKRSILVVFLIIGIVFIVDIVSAFGFNGTVYDPNGASLNNSVINITVRSLVNWQVVGYNFTTTNETGWFNITIPDNAQWMYEPKITFRNGTGTSSYIAYIGQSLPAFPSAIFNQLGSISFYLKDSGLINITAVNSSGQRTTFDYQIKDVRLGYSVAQSFSTGGGVLEANINVPRNRNYSIVIFPNNSLPVSFSWNNFTSTSTYIIPGNAAGNATKYNVTTRTLHKTFNTTLSIPEITGFINATNVTSSLGWDEFGIAAYILEPGNMIHVTLGAVPYNLSFFRGGSSTDFYNLTNGYYNITLPASAEDSSYILFATARNGTGNYGGFANLTLSYGAANVQINFSMYGLLGAIGNISVSNAASFSSKKNIATRRQNFQLVNVTNASLSQSSVHAEISVDYSNYARVMEFTWMENVGQESNSNFSLPLINMTGVKEMNIFASGGNYAPRRTAPTVSQLITDNNANGNVSNITMNSFNPQAIEASIQAASITMELYTSNSTCDVPDPPAGCRLGGSSNMGEFNPMSAIIGGGKLSFRMGTGGILIHYVNVDMMASGPPDALFDEKTRNGTAGSDFNAAVRFGSGGPTVYDNIMVSIPYSESSGTGLNDTAGVNMSIPVLYDDSWNVIWNATLNGTNASALGGNYSHYSTRQSEWQYLLNNVTCTSDINSFNISTPCYINTTSNNIWIRLPHFSGTGPNVKGTAITAASPSGSTSTSSGGGGGTLITQGWTKTISYDTDLSEGAPITTELAVKHRIKFKSKGGEHYVGILEIGDDDSIKIKIESEPQEAIVKVGSEKKFDLTNDGYYDVGVLLGKIEKKKATVTLRYVHEKILEEVSPSPTPESPEEAETPLFEPKKTEGEFGGVNFVWVITLILAVIIVVGVIYWLKQKRL